MGTVRDITDERAAQVALAESEARYRLIADNARDIIATFDAAGRIIFVSPATKAVLDVEPETLLGAGMLDITHPEDRGPMMAYYQKLIAAGPDAVARPHEFRVQHRDGRWIWIEGQPKLFFGDDGRLVAIQDVGRDVTARKTMEAELVAARAEAEAAAAVKSEFLSNMSHELRTPLTAVLGYSRLISDQADLPDRTRGFIDRIVHAGEALLSTVNDILDFSKLEAGQVEIRAVPCDPGELIRASLDLFGGQAEEKGLRLNLRLSQDLPPSVVLAPERVRQILLNLIGNAVKFTEAGAVDVDARWDPASERLHIAVRDSGRGIPSDQLGHLFKRFSQIEGASTRQHGGTGLGLAICKGLAEAMGGEIGVESRVGDGSCFWFALPAPTASALEDGEGAEIDLVPEGSRILVVDDNAVNRDLVRTLLGAFGAVTLEAPDGEAAVRMAAAEAFDLILMDIRMPGMGGVSAARAIRAGEMNNLAPIIAFSADVRDAPADVFDGVIAKPLQPVDFIGALGRALQPELYAA
jgi:PAS domain S-box-containing protein